MVRSALGAPRGRGLGPGPAFVKSTLLCAAFSLVVRAHAAEPEVGTLTLEQLIAEIEQKNPQLKSRQAEVRAAQEQPIQARAFDDPMLMVELWQADVTLSRIPLMFTLRQPILWPGKLRARAAAVEPEAARARAETASLARTLRLDASRAYYGYWLAVRTEAVLAENQRILELIVAAVNARYRVGRAELAELLKAQESRASAENLLLDVSRERELYIASLNTLLGRPAGARLGTPVTEPQLQPLPDEADLTRQALAQRPELLAGKAMLHKAQATARAASIERAPDLAVWVGFQAILRGSEEHAFTVGVQSSIPSFSLAKSAASQRQALAQADGQREALRQVEAQVAQDVRAALLRTDTAARHIRLHRESLLPLAEQTMEAARAGYQSGRVELTLLLETVRALLEHRLNFERYLAEYGLRRAELEAAVGGPLAEAVRTDGGSR